MATGTVTGNLDEVSGGHLVGKIPEIHFTLNAPNAKAGALIPTEPKTVQPDSNGAFTVNLETTTDMMDDAYYTVSIQWLDAGGNYVKADFPDWKLQVPTGGGSFTNLFGGPPKNQRMVYVSLTPPPNPRNLTLWLKANPANENDPLNTWDLTEWRDA